MQREQTVRQKDSSHGAPSHSASSHSASSHSASSHSASSHGASVHGASSHGAPSHGALPHGESRHGASSHGESVNPLHILERAQDLLEEQRAELARWIADLESVHAGLSQPGDSDAGALQAENEDLRRRLSLLESALAEPAPSKETDELRAQTELLQRLLEEKDAVIEELHNKPNDVQKEATPEIDVDSFEAELLRDRRELEAERQNLNAEIQQLRVRNEELDEATREMEMELSRERAELARERQRLERLRDEVKVDLEKLQRDGGMRDSLAGVQRLRDEQRKPGTRLSSHDEPALNDRGRAFRPRVE
jgi:chromosome segregation ATPase